MRIVVSYTKAVSLENQMNLITRLISEKGYDVYFTSGPSTYDINHKDTKALLFFRIGTAVFLNDVGWPYIYATQNARKPVVVYVTLEGPPVKSTLRYSPIPRLKFVANSHFVAKCLREAELEVQAVVHHAIDAKLSESVYKATSIGRNRDMLWLNKRYKDKCKILYVGRHDPRKKLDLLSKAVDCLNEWGVDDYVLLLYTEPSAKSLFNSPEGEGLKKNVSFVGGFGSRGWAHLLELMAACEYLVFPSVCEGFGLPVLEAMSVGTPCIHCWFPPLSEFSSKEFNFVFSYLYVKDVKQDNLQVWKFHMYEPDMLAESMRDAIDTWKNDPDEYAHYREMAFKHAKKWDYHKTYAKMMELLGVK